MNRNIIIIVVVVLIVAAGGAFLLLKKDDSPVNKSQNTQTEQESVTQASEGTAMQGNLQTLRSDGVARVCTMSYSDTAGSGNGTMYSDGKGRGRIQLSLKTERGNAGESNTLMTGDKVYSWTKTDGGSFGLVFDASTVKANSTSSPTTSSSQTGGKNFELKCKGWTVDESVLTVPSDVKFTSLPATP